MADNQAFIDEINKGYTFKGDSLLLGCAKLNDKVYDNCPISIPFQTLNRHGLIAGATGTGKTKTLQIMAEGLSDAGIPSVHLDIKGDLSGLAAVGVLNDKIKERYAFLNKTYDPIAYTVELLSLSKEKGVKLRATVSEFGPILLSKILELNDTQGGVVSMLFKYCDDHGLPILDLKDLTKILQYATDQGKTDISKEYGNISPATLGTILRKVIELQQQGADGFFGEISFDIHDLMRLDPQGKGMINIIRVTDMQERPKLFSTFLLQMLAEIYATLPEAGDLPKPKLMIFIDEAHLIFNTGSKALLDQIETIIKLIRSKGVGIFFCTQNPMDVPASVLSQLGLKVQHALRAFTANDRSDIKKTAENYPLSAFYKNEELITQLGIGEAMVTLLNEKGVPTPLAHTFLLTPKSRMDILSANEIDTLVAKSVLIPKYNQEIDRDSAFEILNRKIASFSENQTASTLGNTVSGTVKQIKEQPSLFEKTINSSVGKQVQRSIVRTIFGMISKALK